MSARIALVVALAGCVSAFDASFDAAVDTAANLGQAVDTASLREGEHALAAATAPGFMSIVEQWKTGGVSISRDCFEVGKKYQGKGPFGRSSSDTIKGQGRTEEPSVQSCQRRCAKVSGCVHFSFWESNGGCHIQDKTATRTDDKNAVAGPPRCPEPLPQAPATCASYKKCSDHSMFNKGSSVKCSGIASSSCDLKTCCEVQGICASYTSCPSGMFNRGRSVKCSGGATSCDTKTCCQAQATCDSYKSCPKSMPNKGQHMKCLRDADTCDTSTCCHAVEARATCDSFTSCPDDLPVNKGSAVECPGPRGAENDRRSCDVSTCCEAESAVIRQGRLFLGKARLLDNEAIAVIGMIVLVFVLFVCCCCCCRRNDRLPQFNSLKRQPVTRRSNHGSPGISMATGPMSSRRDPWN